MHDTPSRPAGTANLPTTPTDASPGDGAPTGARWLPYVLPFALLLVGTALEGIEAVREHYPIAYALKIGAVATCWWILRARLPRSTWKGVVPAAILGLGAAVLWIWLASLHLERWLPDFLPGADTPGRRTSFHPGEAIEDATWRSLFIACRLFGLVLIVPIVEECFWRGYVARTVISGDFERVAIGRFTATSFAVVTIGFTISHPELLAAATWCLAANAITWKTGNLRAAIAFHLTTNLGLGIWVLAKDAWWLL